MTKSLLSCILLVTLVGCVGCNSEDDGYGWGDPLPIPDHPAFIWNSGPDANTITILDLDKEEIVGYRQVLPRKYCTYDFAVLGKNELFFGIDYFDVPSELGDEIIIVDPSLEEQKLGSISTYPSPAYIYPISRNKAIIGHPFRSYQDTVWTLTLIDMQERKLVKELYIQGLLGNVIQLPDGRTYIFWRETTNSPTQVIQEFYSSTNSLGKRFEFSASVFDPYSAVVIGDSLIASLGSAYKTIEIVSIPSCKITASITLSEKSPEHMVYANNKLYVCHNTGGLMAHGNLNKVSVIDLESKTVTKVLTVCNAPCDIAYSEATNKIVVISHVGTVISIIDPQTDSVTNTLVSDEVGDVDEWGYDRLRIPE